MRALVIGLVGCSIATMAVAQGSFIKKPAPSAPKPAPKPATAKPASQPRPEPSAQAPRAAKLPAAQQAKGTKSSPLDFLAAIKSSFSGKPLAGSQIYSQRLLRLIQADRKGGEIGRLDYDPLCDCQDPDSRFYSYRLTDQTATKATAEVTIGSHSRLIYRMLRQANGWRIDDISSPTTPSLIAYLGGGSEGIAAAKPTPWPNAAELSALAEFALCRVPLTTQFARTTADPQWAYSPNYRLYRIPEPSKFPHLPVHSITVSRSGSFVFLNSYANMNADEARALIPTLFGNLKLNKKTQLPDWKIKKQIYVEDQSAVWIQGIRTGDKYQVIRSKGQAGWDFMLGMNEISVFDKGIVKINCILPSDTVIK